MAQGEAVQAPSITPKRDSEGKFVKGSSGNPLGRPTGSKNRITLLKIMGEQAVREDNLDDMLKVCREVINAALQGDQSSRKLVWEAMISKGINEQKEAKDKVQITINSVEAASKNVTIEGEAEDVNWSTEGSSEPDESGEHPVECEGDPLSEHEQGETS